LVIDFLGCSIIIYLTTNARREAEEAKTPTSKDRRRDGEMIHYTNIEGQT
jgi:hypothetical protein